MLQHWRRRALRVRFPTAPPTLAHLDAFECCRVLCARAEKSWRELLRELLTGSERQSNFRRLCSFNNLTNQHYE